MFRAFWIYSPVLWALIVNPEAPSYDLTVCTSPFYCTIGKIKTFPHHVIRLGHKIMRAILYLQINVETESSEIKYHKTKLN